MNVDLSLQILGDALYALLELHFTLKLIDGAIFLNFYICVCVYVEQWSNTDLLQY